jgi:hypothetical protein
MVIQFAWIGALVALIPGASFILIPMEVVLIYQIAKKHDAFELGAFIFMATVIMSISLFLKALASFLHALPIIGQVANSLVAFGFIYAVGTVAEQHYAKRGQSRG